MNNGFHIPLTFRMGDFTVEAAYLLRAKLADKNEPLQGVQREAVKLMLNRVARVQRWLSRRVRKLYPAVFPFLRSTAGGGT